MNIGRDYIGFFFDSQEFVFLIIYNYIIIL